VLKVFGPIYNSYGNHSRIFFIFLCKRISTLENLGIYALGFLGQGLFGARLIVQLFKSEQAGKVVSPTLFWRLSLGASFLFLIYGLLRNDLIIIFGQTISYFIYIRNLQLKNAWNKVAFPFKLLLITLPFIAICIALFQSDVDDHFIVTSHIFHPIMVIGAIGQLGLNFRFVYQWICAEQIKESVLPAGFWHISIWASVLVIVYSIFHPVHGYEPVLLVSQGLGLIVYVRNLFLLRSQMV
jgi:lipid-A-disaccharide synthase-like uncharacterized protein